MGSGTVHRQNIVKRKNRGQINRCAISSRAGHPCLFFIFIIIIIIADLASEARDHGYSLAEGTKAVVGQGFERTAGFPFL